MKTVVLNNVSQAAGDHTFEFPAPKGKTGKTVTIDVRKISGSGTISACSYAAKVEGSTGNTIQTAASSGDTQWADLPLYPHFTVALTVATAAAVVLITASYEEV